MSIDTAKLTMLNKRQLSKETFEQIIKEKGASLDVYLGYATYLAQCGGVVDSLEMIYHSYKSYYPVSTDKLYNVVNQIIDYLREDYKENATPATRNVFSCPCCMGVLYEPITSLCGHTYCKKCIVKENLKTCRVCQFKFKNFNAASTKTNVLVSELVDRFWSNEVEGVKLRTQGNDAFKNKNLEKAVELYTEAVECAPYDHLLLSNRSHVLHTLGRAEEAIKYAESAIQCQPDWAKGYFRKAMALVSLGRYEEAFISLLQCALLEEPNTLRSIKDEIIKALHRILVKLTNGKRCSSAENIMNSSSRHHHHHNHHHHNHHHHKSVSSNAYSSSEEDVTNSSHIPRPMSSDPEDSGDDTDDGRTRLEHFHHHHHHHRPSEMSATQLEEVPQLRKIMDRLQHELERRRKSSTVGYVRQVDSRNLNKNDFECTLCFRLLYQPVTTPCGHSFCRPCLDRCLDHSTNCPLCKTSIRVYLAERRSAVTEFIELAMQTLMPNECVDRRRQHEEELNELANAGKDKHHEIPIFVATVAFPTVSCPLHVFEPRYRLMIRRCMESGTREFGMCLPLDNGENGYADHGTMVEIRDIEYTNDGRSVLNTVGFRRFKIESKSIKDGYNTATVEFLQDDAVSPNCLSETRRLHDTVHQMACKWFQSIDATTKRRILGHYGPIPQVEGEYWTSSNGPSWMWWIVAILPLDKRIQLSVLRETSLRRRLEVIRCILSCVIVQQRSCPIPATAQ